MKNKDYLLRNEPYLTLFIKHLENLGFKELLEQIHHSTYINEMAGTYHTDKHMVDVAHIAHMLMVSESLSTDSSDVNYLCVLAACLTHDANHAGFMVRSDEDNVKVSIEWIKTKHKEGLFPPSLEHHLDTIVRLVKATEVPFVSQATDVYENIIRDADMLYSYQTNADEIVNVQLYGELNRVVEAPMSPLEWHKRNIDYYGRLEFFTESAKVVRAENLRSVENAIGVRAYSPTPSDHYGNDYRHDLAFSKSRLGSLTVNPFNDKYDWTTLRNEFLTRLCNAILCESEGILYHEDKADQYVDDWVAAGLDKDRAATIYLLSYTNYYPYNKPRHEVSKWVESVYPLFNWAFDSIAIKLGYKDDKGMYEAARLCVAAANLYKFPDNSFFTLTGARHWSKNMHQQSSVIMENVKERYGHSTYMYLRNQHLDGFTDQWDLFMTREEAFVVAAVQGQLNLYRKKSGNVTQPKLFSEDIY